MKRISIVLFSFLVIIFGGCGMVQTPSTAKVGEGGLSKDIYYTTTGFSDALSENYMVVMEKDLRIVDLNTKKTIKEIETPNNYIAGYDICGTKVVWSAFGSKEEVGKDPYYDETANTDVFLYDIATDKIKQITTNKAGQINPKIWGDYIVWEDNRNDNAHDKNPEWKIYLYKISTSEEKLISTASGIHTNPSINDDKIVWEDGRNFKGKKELRWGENVPENNTDIYMYDIKSDKEEVIASGTLQECKPTIYGNYIAWEDRNSKSYAADIYLYDLNKKEKIRVTKDNFNQSDPKLFGQYLVWTDERNGGSSNDVVVNGKEPNSDIFLYDIEARKEYLMTGEKPQIMPALSGNYLSYITSSQISAEIQVIKYK